MSCSDVQGSGLSGTTSEPVVHCEPAAFAAIQGATCQQPYAPIALFAYKRPQHTLAVLNALKANELADSSVLYVYCDGPKNRAEIPLVNAVRQIAKSQPWCGQLHVIERDQNLGLAKSVIAGVTNLVERHGTAIVLEDDLVVAPGFLQFMNQGLNRYRHVPAVMQISGYLLPVPVPPELDALYLPFTTSWGWATWARAWRHFDAEMTGYQRLMTDKELRRRFDLDGTMRFSELVLQQRMGTIDSWAIRWYLSTFLQGGLTLYPACSMVQNNGFDGTGTHCAAGTDFDVMLKSRLVLRWPEDTNIASDVYQAVVEYYRRTQPREFSLVRRIANTLMRSVHKAVAATARGLHMRPSGARRSAG